MAKLNELLENIQNIKNDITNAMIEKGASFTNFASYPNAIENIVSGGGVYRYNSLEEMYNDASSSGLGPMQSDIPYNKFTFPDEIDLGEEMNVSKNGEGVSLAFFKYDNSGKYIFEVNRTSGITNEYAEIIFRVTDNETMMRQFTIHYATSDGIHFTKDACLDTYQWINEQGELDGYEDRTDMIDEIELPIEIYYSLDQEYRDDPEFQAMYNGTGYTGWMHILGCFFQVGSDSGSSSTHNIGDLAVTYVKESGNWDGSSTNKLIFPSSFTCTTSPRNSYINLDNHGSRAQYTNNIFLTTVTITINTGTESIAVSYTGTRAGEYTKTAGPNEIESSTGFICEDIDEFWTNFFEFSQTSLNGVYEYNGTNFYLVDTQFTARPDLVLSGKFYGENGVEVGNLSNMKLTLNQCKDRINLYSSLSNLSTSESITNMHNIFNDTYNLQVVPNLDTSNVTNMYETFAYFFNLTTIPNYNTSNVTNMSRMFGSCYDLTAVPNLDTNNVTNMRAMFYSCYNLTTIPNYNTSNVTNMCEMFQGCNHLITIPNLNTSNVTNMENMFYACSNLIIVPNLDMHNVTRASNLFEGCTNLKTVPNFNFSNLAGMGSMFMGCPNLIEVPNFDTSNIIGMSWTFSNCNNLQTIPNFNTSKVTSMRETFRYCYNLLNVPNLDTSNVTDMYGLFRNCNKLVNVPQFNTSKVTDMSYMFANCNSLIDVPNLDTSNVLYMHDMFSQARMIVNVPQFNTSKVTSMSGMFSYCNNLSNASIQNIINMCLNSNITNATYMNLNPDNTYSPLSATKFNSSYYSNRLSELTAKGWKY